MPSWYTPFKRGWHALLHSPCPLCHANRADEQLLCSDCLAALPTPPAFELDPDFTVLYAFYYDKPIRELILKLKFAHSLADLQLLAQLMTTRLVPRIIDKPELIIPVPLHPKRLRSRGFNQALELAKPLGNALNCRISTAFIKRTQSTKAQSSLRATERVENVQHAFAVIQPIPYRHVALLDDVITTGATLGALKHLLQAQGVERVDFYACARPLG